MVQQEINVLGGAGKAGRVQGKPADDGETDTLFAEPLQNNFKDRFEIHNLSVRRQGNIGIDVGVDIGIVAHALHAETKKA